MGEQTQGDWTLLWQHGQWQHVSITSHPDDNTANSIKFWYQHAPITTCVYDITSWWQMNLHNMSPWHHMLMTTLPVTTLLNDITSWLQHDPWQCISMKSHTDDKMSLVQHVSMTSHPDENTAGYNRYHVLIPTCSITTCLFDITYWWKHMTHLY